jgi:peroxiredoxin
MFSTNSIQAKHGGAVMNLKIGERFPDIELPDQDGQAVKLSELVGKFPFILTFYRGYW